MLSKKPSANWCFINTRRLRGENPLQLVARGLIKLKNTKKRAHTVFNIRIVFIIFQYVYLKYNQYHIFITL